jgi:hypothetical protein
MKIKKSQMRHKWIVWLYSPVGRLGAGVPIKPGIIVSSRKTAKFLASNHASKAVGNEGVWCRWSHNIRSIQASNDYIHFIDVTTAHHIDDDQIRRVLCDLSELEFVMMMECESSRKRYARASRNLAVIGERHEAVFRSIAIGIGAAVSVLFLNKLCENP